MGVPRKRNNSQGRRLYREMRRRVDALHRAYEQLTLTGDDTGAHCCDPDESQCHPLSLDYLLHHELNRIRKKRVIAHQYLLNLAKNFAEKMSDQEMNPAVRAKFGIERAMMEQSIIALAAFSHSIPDCWGGCQGFSSGFSNRKNEIFFDTNTFQGLTDSDLESLQNILISLDKVRDTYNLEATWQSLEPNITLIADAMRPPMDALALVATLIKENIEDGVKPLHKILALQGEYRNIPPILCIGMGFFAGAQALSVWLPYYRIYSNPYPYQEKDILQWGWEAIILNIPSFHAWQVASLTWKGDDYSFSKRKAILRGDHCSKTPTAHVGKLVKLALENQAPGKPLVILGDPQPYHEAVKILKGKNVIEPLMLKHMDTSKRGIWVGYGKRPWAPHNMPSPTGKVISFWSWK